MDWEKKFIRKPAVRPIDRITIHERNGVVWFSFPILDQFDFLVNAFSTRIGGVSEGYLSSMNLSLSREISGGLGQAGLRTDVSELGEWERYMDCGTERRPAHESRSPLPAARRAESESARKPEPEAARRTESEDGLRYAVDRLDSGGYSDQAGGSGSPMERFLENHRRFSESVGYDWRDAVFSDQTHTDHILEVTEKDRGNGILRPNVFHDVDGLMTDRKRVAMMTFYADCVPLLIVDPVRQAAACVHSGWRGTIAGIGEKAVWRMRERYGSDPKDIVAAIGPSICGDCYEVSDEVADQFLEKYSVREAAVSETKAGLTRAGNKRTEAAGKPEGAIVIPGRPGHATLNLQEACRQNFLRAGLSYDHISVPDICTAENSGFLFSHRALNGKRGNLAAVLELKQ